MHMADALVSPAVAVTMYACSALAAGHSVHRVRLEEEHKKVATMGVMGAFVFAAQMINFTIPGTGSSGHLCGSVLLSAMLGPSAGFLTMICILLIQCLVFADGGILALGCNVFNMAAFGCFVGGYLIWKQFMKKGVTKGKIIAASIISCVVTLQLGAFAVTLETLASGITKLPFHVFVAAMQPIHLAIGFVEGLITTAILVFAYEARPELLWTGNGEATGEGRMSRRSTLVILAVVTVLVAGGLSLFASTHPDGLEWSIKKVAGTSELEAGGNAYQTAESIQDKTAIFPDYTFADSDSAVGTSVSGILGGILVVASCVTICYLLRFISKGKTKKTHE